MSGAIRFGCFEVDLAAHQIYKRGARIRLREQSFQVLSLLLQHAGEVVTREELRHRLWTGDVFVDFENSLNTAVARLREALSDSADHPRYIETLPRVGYRFIAPIAESGSGREPAVTPGPKARLVVLPFVNSDGDPAQEYFSDAMTDEIISNLAAIAPDALAVIARTTAMHYKGSHKDVARIGRELGVDYIVEGSVRRNNGHIDVHVQLVEVSNQTHLFAKAFGGDLEDVFGIQRRIAQAILAQIPVARATREIEGAAAHTRTLTADLAAYNEHIQGLYLMAKATPDAFDKARQHQERAIACDPEFAAAYDALAELYWYLGYTGLVSPRDAFSRGIVYAVRALEIDNTRGETHALLGQFHKTIEYNWTEVEREMALARRLAPTSPLVSVRYALSGLMPHGRLEEAVLELDRALELDPLSSIARFWLGIMLLLWRRYDRAIEAQRTLLELDPTHWGPYFVMSGCYRYLGMLDEAVAAGRRALELSGDAAHNLGWLGLTLAEAGQPAEARELLQRLHRKAEIGFVPPTSFAWIHLGLGETDNAFYWLERGVEECDQRMMPIKTYRFFDPIRPDPRFRELLRKMHLDGNNA